MVDGALRQGRLRGVIRTRSLDPGTASATQRMAWLSAFVAPRPVLVVVTRDVDGRAHAAPFSSVLPLGIDPLRLAIGIHPRLDGESKATLRDAEAQGELTAQVVGSDLLPRVVALGQEGSDRHLPAGELVSSQLVQTPRWGLAPVQLECRVCETVRLASAPLALVVSEVVRLHVADALWDGDEFAPERLAYAGHLDTRPPDIHAFLVDGRRRDLAR